MSTETQQAPSTQELSDARAPDIRFDGELEGYTFLAGKLERAYTQRDVRSTWDMIIPGAFLEFTEATNLLFYDGTAGVGEFYLPSGEGGEPQLLKRHTDWRRGWDLIVPSNFLEASKGDSLLFYDREEGLGELYGTGDEGDIFRVARFTNWRRTWNAILPILPLDVAPDAPLAFDSILFYDRAAGHGEFYATDGQGRISRVASHTNWRRTWDLIVPFTQSTSDANRTTLVFYDRNAGHGELYAVDGQGGIALLAAHTNWRRTWDMIIPCRISDTGANGLLFYDRSVGQGELYAVDGRGSIAQVARYTNWRRTWDAIVFGTLAGSGPILDPGLLFYER
ncbi:hypothetical protein JRI60_01145 [Archangium violaceum]|uniref:hypothetical protein n=1 Tax=Archangium violaceum TaxID=83451 RepID=UPI00195197D8|nr:hypothetical protein [Archangium violaceum]QRN97723.1 hypothetical protein JRI60_01145 [Archangium violaceum]